MVFALPDELVLAEVAGDFKIHFHDRQGDFYCWLNTTMMEKRKVLNSFDIDGFDKRKLPSPGFQVEVVLADYDGFVPNRPSRPVANQETDGVPATNDPIGESNKPSPTNTSLESPRNKDDVFSDSEAEEGGSSKSRRSQATVATAALPAASKASEADTSLKEQSENITHGVQQVSSKVEEAEKIAAPERGIAESKFSSASGSTFQAPELESASASEFKAIAADASVFSFGDEDYESE